MSKKKNLTANAVRTLAAKRLLNMGDESFTEYHVTPSGKIWVINSTSAFFGDGIDSFVEYESKKGLWSKVDKYFGCKTTHKVTMPLGMIRTKYHSYRNDYSLRKLGTKSFNYFGDEYPVDNTRFMADLVGGNKKNVEYAKAQFGKHWALVIKGEYGTGIVTPMETGGKND